MLHSKRWYLQAMHCFTPILVMVYLLGISPQTKINKRFLNFKKCLRLMTSSHYLSHSMPLLSSLKTLIKLDDTVNS